MLDSSSFEMVDRVSRTWILSHPVWRQYDERQDRAAIVAWGVSEAKIESELKRLESCGTQPFFPVLAVDPLPASQHLIIAARFVTPAGTEVPGYLLRPHAFGLYVGEEEFTFNANLPSAAAAASEKLTAVLGEATGIFPLHYETGLCDHEGNAIGGWIPRIP